MFDWTRRAQIRIEKEEPHPYNRSEKYWACHASCYVSQLVSDCSSFNMGELGASSQKAANMLIHAIFKQYGAQLKEENFMWKVLLTNTENAFRDLASVRRVSKALEDICCAEHKTSVHSWTGKPFEFRVYEVQKDFEELPDLELPADFGSYRVLILDDKRDESYESYIKQLNVDKIDNNRNNDWD